MGRRRALKAAPTQRTLRLDDGRRLALRRWPGRGTPLVLLHGLLDSAEGWDRLAASSSHPCIAFDLPGFGGSDLPTRPRVSAYADDVLAGLDRLGLDEVVLVGHSLGGAIATAMAERVPERVDALVLLAPAGFGRIPLAEAVTVPGVRDVTARLLPLALSNRVLVNLAYGTFVAPGHALEARALKRARAGAATSVPGARDATRAVVAAGLSKRGFHRREVAYDGPVAAVWGARDRVVPRGHADGVLYALPQAEIEVWKGVGHHPQHECPDRLLDFVEGACEGEALGRVA